MSSVRFADHGSGTIASCCITTFPSCMVPCNLTTVCSRFKRLNLPLS